MPDSLLRELKIEDLWAVVGCEKFDDLNSDFKRYLPKIESLFTTQEFDGHDRALESAIDSSTEPLDTYWYLICLVSLGVAQPMVTFCILFILAGYFLANYESKEEQAKKKNIENIQFVQFQRLRNAAADEMLERLHQVPDWQAFKRLPHKEVVTDAKPMAPSKTEALRAGTKVGVAFFGAYYLSTAWIFYEIGFTLAVSAMTGPIGLAVAGVIALFITAYCIYDHYKTKEGANLITYEKNKITTIVKNKENECRDLYVAQQNLVPGFFKPKQALLDVKPVTKVSHHSKLGS